MKNIFTILLVGSLVFCTKTKSNNNKEIAALALLSSSSTSVSVPKLLTVVNDSLPSTLKNTSYTTASSLKALSDITTVQTRIFSSGPADFRYRLSMVDKELTEALTQRGAALSSCFTSTGETWTPSTFTVSGVSFSFPLVIKCKVSKSTPSADLTATSYYGADANFYYIANLTTAAATSSSDSILVLAKVNKSGTSAEVFQLGLKPTTGERSILQIKADKSTPSFEIATASNSGATSSGVNYTGVGCGIQLKANGTYGYGSGKFSQTSCSSTTATTQCVDASGGSLTASSSCPASIQSFSVLTLSNTIMDDSTVLSSITNIGNAVGVPSTLTTFQ